MKITYVKIELTDEEIPQLKTDSFFRWIPYILHCYHTVHIIRLKPDLVANIDIYLTTLTPIPGSFYRLNKNTTPEINITKLEPAGISKKTGSSAFKAHTQGKIEPFIRIHLSGARIHKNPLLFIVLEHMKSTTSRGNLYLKQKIIILHNYYVMDVSQTPAENTIILNVGAVEQWFKLIPSISAKFPSIYKFLIQANAKNNWINIYENEDNWFILQTIMPAHIHSKLIGLLY